MSAIQFESIKKKTLQPLFWCRSCGIEGLWLSNHTTSKWLNRDLAQPLILSAPSILQPFLFSPTSILRHLECSLCLVIYLLKAWYCLGKYSPLVGKTFPQSGLASTAMSPSVLALNPQLNVNGPTVFLLTSVVHAFLPVRGTLLFPSLPSTWTILWVYWGTSLFPSTLREAFPGHSYPRAPHPALAVWSLELSLG